MARGLSDTAVCMGRRSSFSGNIAQVELLGQDMADCLSFVYDTNVSGEYNSGDRSTRRKVQWHGSRNWPEGGGRG